MSNNKVQTIGVLSKEFMLQTGVYKKMEDLQVLIIADSMILYTSDPKTPPENS